MRGAMKKIILVGCMVMMVLSVTCCGLSSAPQKNSSGYGVFLSLDHEDMESLYGYNQIVIDAQYFEKEDIQLLKQSGTKVYTYLNLGSLENFRTYYAEFLDLTLDDYENWEEEKWVNVSDPRWQKFLGETLATQLLEKGVDGFFVDNCDVYYQYPTEEMYNGVTTILKSLRGYGVDVIINGGDTYVSEYIARNNEISGIMSGLNQESVYTGIDFSNHTFYQADKSDTKYYLSYIKKVEKLGGSIYLLEYATDKALKKKIVKQCEKNNWNYYIADSLELD